MQFYGIQIMHQKKKLTLIYIIHIFVAYRNISSLFPHGHVSFVRRSTCYSYRWIMGIIH